MNTSADRLRISALLAILAIVVIEAVHAFYVAQHRLYDEDAYEFLEAARTVVDFGAPRILYWPNSTAGLDIFYWSFYLLGYFYSAFVYLFDMGILGLEYLRFSELLVVLCVVAIALRHLAGKYFLPATVLIIADPVFNFIVLSRQYMRWPVAVGILGLWVLFLLLESNKPATRYLMAGILGLIAATAPLIFVSMGAPVALGLSAAFLVEVIAERRSVRKSMAMLAAFSVPPLVAIFALGAQAASTINADQFHDLIKTVGYYGSVVSTSSSFGHEIQKIGYFFSTLFVSPYGPTLLPVGLAAIIINLIDWPLLDGVERRMTRITMVCVAAWILPALVIPTHFYSARLIWVLPLLILQIAFCIRRMDSRVHSPAILILIAASFATSQLAHKFGTSVANPYVLGIFAGAGLMLATTTTSLALTLRRRGMRILAHVQQHRYAWCIVIAALICLPTMLKYSGIVANDLPKLVSADSQKSPRVPVNKLAIATKELFRDLVPGDWVVTNYPLRELFPDGVRIQSIQHYRGLFNGARQEPAKILVRFIQPGGRQAKSTTSAETNFLYYRGHIYEIGSTQALPFNYRVEIGKPVSWDNQIVAENLDNVDRSDLLEYFDWRVSNGLRSE